MPTSMSRHGRRRVGQVVCTFALAESLKREIGRIAFGEGLTPSEWMRLHLRDTVRRHLAAKRAKESAA